MKTKVIAGAAMLVLSQLAAAQSSVTLYGVADVGFELLNHANAAGDSLFRTTSGNVSGSRWGLRGIEDLGGGDRALFVLENGFEIDTGMSVLGGRIFGRNAYIGLANQWGQLTFGRQQNALYDVLINYEPMVLPARYSAIMMDPNFSGRYDNTVKYTGSFGPITAIALYSFARGTSITGSGVASFGSETPGDIKSDASFGGSLEYSSGSFGAAVIYDQQQGTRGAGTQTSDQRDRRLALATSMSFGNSTILVGYRWFHGDIGVAAGAASKRNDVYWLGYRYQASPALRLTAAGYAFNDRRSGMDPFSLVGSATYALSKRTDATFAIGYVHNKNNSNLGLNGFGTAIESGKMQTGVMLSMRHKF